MNYKGKDAITRIHTLMEGVNGVKSNRNNSNIITTLTDFRNDEYGVVLEGNKYHVKKIIDVGGIKTHTFIKDLNSHTKSNIFESRVEAEKKLNYFIRTLNEEEKFVLNIEDKGNNSGSNTVGSDSVTSEPSRDSGLGDLDLDSGGENGGDTGSDLDLGDNTDGKEDSDDDIDPKKTVQKWTGKLAQKMREYQGDDGGDLSKYVINTIISALNWDNITPEDIDDIIGKVEEKLENKEKSKEELDISGGDSGEVELDLDLGSDDSTDGATLDLDLDSIDESDMRYLEDLLNENKFYDDVKYYHNDNVKIQTGDKISFNIASNRPKKLKGVVKNDSGLGHIVTVNGQTHELRKLMNITKIN